QQDLANVSTCLNNIAGIYTVLGDPQKSMDYYNRAFEARQSMGDRAAMARTRLGLAFVLQSIGESQKAIEQYEQALPVLRGSDRNREAITLNGMGYCYASLGDTQMALEYCNEALSIQEKAGRIREAAATLNNIGNVYVQMGEQRRALEYFERALSYHLR